jgi:hypothetical protein
MNFNFFAEFSTEIFFYTFCEPIIVSFPLACSYSIHSYCTGATIFESKILLVQLSAQCTYHSNYKETVVASTFVIYMYVIIMCVSIEKLILKSGNEAPNLSINILTEGKNA